VNVRIRAIETEGSQMLREYLRLSIFVRPGDPPAADVVSRQEIARYVDGWGRRGDDAVAAIDAASGADLGAAWLRLWTPPTSATASSTPRRRSLVSRSGPSTAAAGSARRCCTRCWRAPRIATPRRPSASAQNNPAVRLYERLGFRVVAVAGGSLTMVKPLR
jgi:hypothetical protein